MKKKIIAALLTGVMTASLAACGTTSTQTSSSDTSQDKELTKITFALDWTPNTNHTGLYVADALGYFEDAGIEVEFVQTSSGYGSELVGVGQAEFGIDFQDTMAYTYASEDPIPVTAIAAVIQHNTSGIITRADSNVTSPKGLEGLHYATWEDPMEQTLLEYCVEQDGGVWDNVILDPVTVDDAVAGLQSNIDAVWIYYAWDGIRAELSDLDTNFFFLKDYCSDMDEYTPVIIGNDEYMQENPEVTKAFVAAVRKGYEYAIDNPDEAAKILCEEVPELDEELVTASQEWLADQYSKDAPYWGYIDEERWDGVYDWMYENKLVENEIADGTGFTNDYNPE
ncbi:ABC transporter substrate-binding protein [Eubacterium oxidoreducens]|uniref:ABC-type nitrate/sulfonate/bicarbonate transport system, substrate-binding protein n=1 Tax=Eubacterium oxidoreducens TaxID=1732 RepID=A0A1G6C4C8_EUBOX|nr:ABC transporter substrate-binding protein [Eubacterium oxidoreducens]SDB27697.1 ABC-type nitrate/sulfonate/bicarbonate transport system, substrate-binding protein [Eubacterium oxidoreducens]